MHYLPWKIVSLSDNTSQSGLHLDTSISHVDRCFVSFTAVCRRDLELLSIYRLEQDGSGSEHRVVPNLLQLVFWMLYTI